MNLPTGLALNTDIRQTFLLQLGTKVKSTLQCSYFLFFYITTTNFQEFYACYIFTVALIVKGHYVAKMVKKKKIR